MMKYGSSKDSHAGNCIENIPTPCMYNSIQEFFMPLLVHMLKKISTTCKHTGVFYGARLLGFTFDVSQVQVSYDTSSSDATNTRI